MRALDIVANSARSTTDRATIVFAKHVLARALCKEIAGVTALVFSLTTWPIFAVLYGTPDNIYSYNLMKNINYAAKYISI